MATIVRLPKLGLSDRGEIVDWVVSPPADVVEGDVIAILESDKSAVDIEATADGTLIATYVDEGEEIEIEPGRPIAAIGSPGESPPTLEGIDDSDISEPENEDAAGQVMEPASSTQSGGNDLRVTPKARVLASDLDVPIDEVEPTGPEGSVTSGDVQRFADTELVEDDNEEQAAAEVKATPKAKRLAREQSIELATVSGTGPAGAVSADDIRRHLAGGGYDEPVREGPTNTTGTSSLDQATPSESAEFTVAEVRERSRLQRAGAERLSRSAREKPHVRGNRTVNIEPLQRVVEELSSSGEAGPSLNDLLFGAIVQTLGDHPEFNAVFQDEEYRLIEERNVGYAVDSDDGLVVPVIKDAGSQSIDELAASRRAAVDRVLEGNYEPNDLQGGTFTVTNVGALGMDSAFSIINPPEVAILVLGRRKPVLFEDDDDVKTVTGMELSLLIDHRVLDGGDAGAFLATLANYIEQPSRLLYDAP